jgi:hypothetical protein
MCRPGYLSNTVCTDISIDATLRPSHFPCYPCIKASAQADASEKRHEAYARATATHITQEGALKARAAHEARVREDRVRVEAKEKADRERAEEQKVRVEREREVERAKKEGGAWIVAETGSAKKKKGGKGAGMASLESLKSSQSLAKKGTRKESEADTEMSRRAGTWGPKKILSRKEGSTVILANTTNGVKK